jgi:murein DD-endopeptidase MepM/ murein hydrolase activator NlpD
MRDYKPASARPQPRARWLLWFVAGLGLPLALVALLLPDQGQPPPMSPEPTESAMQVRPVTPPETSPPAAPVKPAEAEPSTDIPELVAAPEPDSTRTVLIVRSGDSMDRMFRRNGLSITDLALIMQEDLARTHLRVIKPGDEIVVMHRDDKVIELTREIDFASGLKVSRTDDGFSATTIAHKITAREIEAEGRISSSLFLAAAEAGVSERTIMNLAGIFAWDIDFVLDIRQGDEFHVIVEELWRDGQRLAEGDILAAEFVNQGKTYRAIRYKDPEGNVSYFTPDGRNMRKAFLRAPLSFSRISSNFNPNRRHPVLNTLRAHKGVDYAASHGTPVKAAGGGKVIFRGVQGGYGNVVIVQHGGNITTLYAHLSNFNRQARLGTRVKQGQVIGYVGQSGLATGPHLHYEYRKNGVHMNPRTVSLPDAAPIDPSLKEDFLRTAAPLISQLDRTPPGRERTTAGEKPATAPLKTAGQANDIQRK